MVVLSPSPQGNHLKLAMRGRRRYIYHKCLGGICKKQIFKTAQVLIVQCEVEILKMASISWHDGERTTTRASTVAAASNELMMEEEGIMTLQEQTVQGQHLSLSETGEYGLQSCLAKMLKKE